MGKLIYTLNVSLDGYIETPDHGLDWANVDDELHSWFNDELRTIDASLYGRRLYEVMAAYWPTGETDPDATETTREFARIWNAVPRFVFSTTLEEVQWNSRLVRGDVGEVLARIREEFDGDLEVGGPTLAAEFIRRGLVDEYRLVVHPVVLGAGTPFFPPLDEPLRLRLVDTRRFASGARLPGLRPRLRSIAATIGRRCPTTPRRATPPTTRSTPTTRTTRRPTTDAGDAGERRHDLTNGDLARLFHEIGDMLEVKGEIAFKTIAYHRAADAIGRSPVDLVAAYRAGKPPKIPGVGQAISDKIAELVATGHMAYLRAPPRGDPAEPRRAARDPGPRAEDRPPRLRGARRRDARGPPPGGRGGHAPRPQGHLGARPSS